MRHLNPHALMLLIALVLPALALPMQASAATDAAMQQSLKSFFNQGVVLQGATAELITVQHWPNASGSMRWSLPASLRNHPGRFSLIAEQGNRRWYVPVLVRWMATAIVMRQQVSARSLLTQSMMKKTRTDIAGHHGPWWQNSETLVGMRLTRPLASGEVILASHVKRPPMIKRGDLVAIMLDVGGVHIRTEGKAMRTAGRGERIMVRNLRSKEVIQAVVENTGLVRVSLHGGRG
ncbi:MAG: flagella basal body P-ring formation protein FlgA [Zetaproteobacteria bacterium CG_4_9_14_3_um_filter_54_145]|nr:MAG: flagella basal body P-ring formation protein FlgA [Zetaproteobacteria bacterium CG_4_10_14_3_um_filter_54_28]PJA29983.1 MAG: flagella basal body P-ring formation protein FlgA [Zetaproteobacteria bacterium CG_4_9_14_3_um_filter_54_145]